MKIVSSDLMSKLEFLAYKEGASESDFMEEAGSGVALVANDYVEVHQLERQVALLCGKGNNAGDTYVAGIHLRQLDFEVVAYSLVPLNECSLLCRENQRRFLDEGGQIREINSPDEISFPRRGIILDGLFGTGFHGQIAEPYASVIRLANLSRIPIIAVDIPSGLNGDTGEVEGEAIIAAETAFLGLPKMGFFLREGWNHVGRLRYVDFGLPRKFIDQAPSELMMLTEDMMRLIFPPLIRNRHKYQAGYVVGLAGSPGYSGAALLSSLASLKGGAGITRLLYPEGMLEELTSGPFELIKMPYKFSEPTLVLETLNKASATYIGPGLGLTEEVSGLLKYILSNLSKPCVIDADALTLMSEDKFDSKLPDKVILTPHMGELLRLLKLPSPQTLDQSLLEKCQQYAETRNVTLVLKGGPTFIFSPFRPIMVNITGDPGMATAGSGDVLTGLLAALLAQGLEPHLAAYLGVFIHGIAGEFAAEELTSYCMIASDILFYFPEGFKLYAS
jgi:ADP-dependent NAD(P)H-hydrate dehydratase / NAD(P)H-hydrate epimerase